MRPPYGLGKLQAREALLTCGCDVGGQGQAAAPVSPVWTQLSGTQQCGDSTNGVSTLENAMSSRFQ